MRTKKVNNRICVVVFFVAFILAANCVTHDRMMYRGHLLTIDIPHHLDITWEQYVGARIRESGITGDYVIQPIYELDDESLSLSFHQGARVHSVNVYQHKEEIK